MVFLFFGQYRPAAKRFAFLRPEAEVVPRVQFSFGQKISCTRKPPALQPRGIQRTQSQPSISSCWAAFVENPPYGSKRKAQQRPQFLGTCFLFSQEGEGFHRGSVSSGCTSCALRFRERFGPASAVFLPEAASVMSRLCPACVARFHEWQPQTRVETAEISRLLEI